MNIDLSKKKKNILTIITLDLQGGISCTSN